MIEFDEKKHEYKLDGAVVPSVTQITRFLHYDEASGANKWMRDEAAKKGTLIHETTVLLDYGEDIPDDFPAEYLGYIKAYQRFRRDFPEMEYSGIESVLGAYSNEGKPDFAGTIDRWGFREGQPFILDIKTGSKLNHAAITAQMHGYRSLLYSNYRVCPNLLYTLHLRKEGVYNLYKEECCANLFYMCKSLQEYINIKGEKL